jgi:putative copper export protein
VVRPKLHAALTNFLVLNVVVVKKVTLMCSMIEKTKTKTVHAYLTMKKTRCWMMRIMIILLLRVALVITRLRTKGTRVSMNIGRLDMTLLCSSNSTRGHC